MLQNRLIISIISSSGLQFIPCIGIMRSREQKRENPERNSLRQTTKEREYLEIEKHTCMAITNKKKDKDSIDRIRMDMSY